jgi:hypothetical protein
MNDLILREEERDADPLGCDGITTQPKMTIPNDMNVLIVPALGQTLIPYLFKIILHILNLVKNIRIKMGAYIFFDNSPGLFP